MEIKINRLFLENFKCHRLLNLQLDGRSVSIYGDNATGKTSIYDALTWLLFGKDSVGNGEKNIDIKPLDPSGEVRDHQAITSVEAEFQADGETVTLRRTYREIWATRRGSGDPVYEGNTSDYFVDGVPQKKNAFDARVRELVPEDLFRMLTSVSHFAAGMKWQDRRAVLFDMAGTLTDREIMEGAPQFAPLLDSMGRLSLSDYKAKLMSQKKGLNGVRDDAPTRINECQRVIDDLLGIDFEDARKEEKYLVAEKEDLSRQLISLEQDAELEKKRLELREAKLERDTLEAKNNDYRDSQKAAGPDPTGIRKAIAEEQRRLNCDKTFLETTNRTIQRCDREIQDSRDTYVRINGEAFAGGLCPTCGQALPFEQLQEATRKFNEKKEIRLAEIISRANRLKEEKQNFLDHGAVVEASIGNRKARIQELEEQLRTIGESTVEINDLPEYAEAMAEKEQRISGLQDEINRLMADSSNVRNDIREKLAAVTDQLYFTQKILAKEAVLEQTRKRVEELKADARNASEALESIEKMLYLMEEFTRYKAKRVESSVNDLFRLASFRLFREQANGGLEERCDAQYNGVPFMGLNNGMKVNVGIDIINALSRFYGVTVPLFVDNAEAVTRLESCNAQVIRLVVSEKDKELRIV